MLANIPRPLTPRLIILFGMVLILLAITGVLSPTLASIAQIVGGLSGLVGLIWVVLTINRKP